MSKFKIEWCKNDTYGNKICSVQEGSEVIDYIIPPKDKKGREFPGFADIKPGMVVEGNSWQSKTNGKWYIFAPDENKEAKVYIPKVSIAQAQEVKRENIALAQENKAEAIKISSTMNKAIDLAIATMGSDRGENSMESVILFWRQWIWTHWDAKDSDFPPLP